LICHGICWRCSIRIHRDRGKGIRGRGRGIRVWRQGIRDGGLGIRVEGSGWTGRSMMGLRSSSPRISAVLGKVTGLMTPFTLVFVWTVSSFMGPLTDGALKGLTRVPDVAWIALDVTLKCDVMFQRHGRYECQSKSV